MCKKIIIATSVVLCFCFAMMISQPALPSMPEGFITAFSEHRTINETDTQTPYLIDGDITIELKESFFNTKLDAVYLIIHDVGFADIESRAQAMYKSAIRAAVPSLTTYETDKIVADLGLGLPIRAWADKSFERDKIYYQVVALSNGSKLLAIGTSERIVGEQPIDFFGGEPSPRRNRQP